MFDHHHVVFQLLQLLLYDEDQTPERRADRLDLQTPVGLPQHLLGFSQGCQEIVFLGRVFLKLHIGQLDFGGLKLVQDYS